MAIKAGLVGPKVNPKGVADGYQVNIPELLFFYTDGGTHLDIGQLMIIWAKAKLRN